MRTLDEISRGWTGLGLVLRGAFHPTLRDAPPAFADGVPVGTLVLLGWTGGDQWPFFARSPEALDGAPDPLNRWSKRVIDALAAELGAAAFYPFGGPPWLDFQSWALKAEPVHRSPLGLLIHPEWGLWHSYRGALGFRQRLDLPPRAEGASPCESCSARPCLSACPVSAFSADDPYDHSACYRHVEGAGEDCRNHACAARRACPVAPEKRYSEEQASFHMKAFLENRLG
jgi:hypothetical protein